MKRILFVIIIFTCVFLYSVVAYSNTAFSGIKENVIRLHIVANSNSEFDQSIKLKLRDELLGNIKFKSDNIDDLKKEIPGMLPDIERISNEFLKREKVPYIAYAAFGAADFPTKKYANIKLPSGEYNALKITLGNAGGENWWCVMFPPLCFTDGITGQITPEGDKVLKKSLTEEEYKLVTADTAGYEVKFKVIEIVNMLKNKFI